ncbi:MAG: DNA-processing protein DprA [Brachymonas sp.]|nr:DNA-processing protein DprA [Brachymonas sp.]
MNREELSAWLTLLQADGIGNDAARRLLAAFGLPQQVLAQGLQALEQVVSARQAAALRKPSDATQELIERTWQWLQQEESGLQRRILVLGSSDYPPSLLHMADPPVLLYAMGQLDRLPLAKQGIALVGSRTPTPQGAQDARAFARYFATQGLPVISGLALGIDGAAHEGALEAAAQEELATIAVVGTGIDRVYPRQHRELAHRIAQHGVILSEYPLGTPPAAHQFPKRNRLIAGLSQGVLVVEAALQSGSLITARLAAEQGKEVFAIPGSIHSPHAKGCHLLIRQGAKLVESAQDVLEELPGYFSAGTDRQQGQAVEEPDDEAGQEANPLLQALGHDPVGLDALLARTGMDAATLQARLLELELAGHVGRLPGGLFQRIERG